MSHTQHEPSSERGLPDETKGLQTTLTMPQVNGLLQQAGISEKDFDKPWQLEASVYRELIWELANSFVVNTKPDWLPELTHSEYLLGSKADETTTIQLCLDISDENDANQSEEAYVLFRDFLERNQGLIPTELRQLFIMIIGFNYGDRGGIQITKNAITSIPQSTFDAIEGEGRIAFIRDREKDKKFILSLREEINRHLQ